MNAKDPMDRLLDQLLKDQPLSPSIDFTDEVMKRISLRPQVSLDSWLADQSITPKPGFSSRVMEAIEREPAVTTSRGTFVRQPKFPAWALLGGMAATLALGALAFLAMVQHAGQVTPAAAPPSPEPATVTHLASNVVLPGETIDCSAWEDLLLLEFALDEVAAIAEPDALQTFALLAQ